MLVRGTLAFSIVGLLIGAGCLGLSTHGPGQAKVEFVDGGFEHRMNVHVVTVGFDHFDAAELQSNLKQPLAPFRMIRADTTGQIFHEPLRYNVTYLVHTASADFEQGLFAYAASIAKPADVDGYLRNYDSSDEKRVCTQGRQPVPPLPVREMPQCERIQQIDATKIEAWIADHRGAAGLEFADAGYTVFVLDSYTKGLLSNETYHQYAIDDGTTNPDIKRLRAWGGAHDFVFLDVGAAPNWYDNYPWARYERNDASLYDLRDGPIWEYRGEKMGVFYENLARNVFDATRILWARMPLYPFEYAPKYILPMYVIIDPQSTSNPKSPLYKYHPSDVQVKTNRAMIEKAFQDLVPWATIDLRLKFIYLPDDDPGLAAAVRDAKSRYSEEYIDFGIVKKYVREHFDAYAPKEPGARTYPTFAFMLEYPTTGLYAYADGDELGHSFGVFFNAADAFNCGPNTKYLPICFREEIFDGADNWWAWWNAVLVHELGHSFGLTHTHDTSGLDEDNYSTYDLNWLWDSTSSAMTYLHSLGHFDRFDVEVVERAHTVTLAQRILDGGDAVPESARAGARQALQELQRGDYDSSIRTAQKAWSEAGPSVTLEEKIGTPGTPETHVVSAPVGYYPAGCVPAPSWPLYVLPYQVRSVLYQVYYTAGTWVYPKCPSTLYDMEGVDYIDTPVPLPEGAKGVLIEYKEKDAPTHFRQSAYVDILDKKGDYVTGLWNNGHDKAFLLDLNRCKGSCTARFWALSGENLRYDLTFTPYT